MGSIEFERNPTTIALDHHLRAIEQKLGALSTGVTLDPKQLEALVSALAPLRAAMATGDTALEAAYLALRQPIIK